MWEEDGALGLETKFCRVSGVTVGDDATVEGYASGRAHGPADHGRRQAKNRTADASTDRGTNRGKDYRCHWLASSGKAKHAATRRAQGTESGLSTTPCPV